MNTKLLPGRFSKENAFTLMELLVVIVIIGILAAIAIPVYGAQKARAQDTNTISDVRNIAVAAETYLVDPQASAATLTKDKVDFASSPNVSWNILGGASGGYCIVAKNTAGYKYTTNAKVLTYDSLAGGLGKTGGACSTNVASLPVPSGSTAEGTAATFSSMSTYPLSQGTNNVFRQDISDAPLDPQSAEKIVAFRNSFKDLYGGIAAFNVWQYNNATYMVNEDTPRYVVKFNDCQKKGYTPTGWYGDNGQFGTVPIPDGAVPAVGTDKAMMIYSPSEDRIWEFWVTEKAADGSWSACWGGSIKNASQGNGQFSGSWGTTASGLSGLGSMLSLADVRRGYIDHAVSIAIPSPQRGNVYPATRNDGFTSNPLDLKEGTRLRLDPSVNVDALPINRIAKMVAKASQTYGLIITDKAGTVAIVPESGQAEKLLTGVDPWTQILGKTPNYNVFKDFPWDKMQVIQPGWK